MNLAERIERVFYYSGDSLNEIPDNVLSDCWWIKNRYSELKRTLDFESAARQARTEWLEKVIVDDLKNM